jgi:hypothetical protein
MTTLKIFIFLLFIHTSHQIHNGLGLTPQMGITQQYFMYSYSSFLLLKAGTAGIIMHAISMKNSFSKQPI